MKIVFLSNYFNHHQKPLSDALYRMTDKYLFVATAQMSEERKRLGYQTPEAAYVVYLDDASRRAEITTAIEEADAVILGSAPPELVRKRLKSGKLVFRYSERLIKHKDASWKYPLQRLKWGRNNPRKAQLYLLCAGAFVAADYAAYGLLRGNAFRFGYFPQTVKYPDFSDLLKKKKPASLLWVGRFLSWKHPELAVKAVKALKDSGFDVTLDMIGTGGEEATVKKMICSYRLEDRVRLLGAMPYDKVRGYMEQAEIFLCTSDQQEGWGAVINEAMNSGCAVAASHNIGAVPYLLEDGKNGEVFECGNLTMLTEKLVLLLNNPGLRAQMSVNAYHTVTELWNAEVAAERLLKVVEMIQKGKPANELFAEGPCSSAGILSDSWKDRC